jgi:hypothetical protein
LLEAKAGIIRVLVKEGKASCLLVDPSNGTSPLINACGRGLKVAVAELVALGCVDAEQLAFRNFPERGNVSALDVAISVVYATSVNGRANCWSAGRFSYLVLRAADRDRHAGNEQRYLISQLSILFTSCSYSY